uniref:Amine oxidase domain-containing protein n=1 Tax=Panagrolaimus sp. ES5 TaxID=591445 RepID=A0AC34FDD3_9BILA
MSDLRKRVIIIGAGPTAIGSLARLCELMDENTIEPLDITIFERSSHPGGLASTVTDSYGFSWDLGVHITGATRYPAFLKTLQAAVPEWHCIERCVKADMTHVIHASNPQDNYVPYPVQSSVPYFPDEIKQKCLMELNARFSTEQPKEFANFDEFSLYFFGKTLQDLFIRPYNQKVWTVPLEEMNCKWVKGRVPKVDVESIHERSTLSLPELPDCIGMGELWRRVAAKFPQHYFSFNSEVTKIDTETKQVALIGVGLHQPQSFFAQELSWAYFPQPEIIFYRCTVISNFSPLLVPDPTKYWSVLCEIGLEKNENIDSNELIEKTVKGLIKTGVIDSKEQVYSVWTKELDYGYPIPSINRETELQKANNILEKHNIYSRGRFGGWRYETSNQDCSFESGRQVIDKVFLNIPETL